MIEHNLTERHGRALLKLPDYELQRKVLDRVISNELNVSSTEKLVKDILDDLTSEKENEKKKRNIKGFISTRIYINTIKNAFKAIKQSGVNAKYIEKDKGDYLEVTIMIPK